IGNPGFTLVLSGAPGSSLAVLIAGPAPTSIGLGGVGLPGCTILVSPDVLLPTATTIGGAAFVPMPVPPLASLAGAAAHFQWAILPVFSQRLQVQVLP
ncbi:MAG: hypothetical protein L0323_12155, partial [Planctomycetes bacterium]|nr:hypothetical protein [Planctomycetota bacterium]